MRHIFVLALILALGCLPALAAEITIARAAPHRAAAAHALAAYLAAHGVASVDPELPSEWAAKIAEIEREAAAVLHLGTDPSDENIQAAIAEVRQGNVDAVVWITTAAGITCSDLDNCLIVGNAICALQDSDVVGVRCTPEESCIAACQHVASGISWRAHVGCVP